MQALGGATLLCDARCRAALAQHYDLAGWKVQTVADGQTVPLGRRTLRFIETPMAHWPESMFTYVPEEKWLFSMDVFGQHYATAERFDEEVPAEVLFEEAKTYYANILMPYGAAVGKSLAKLAGVALAIIAASHGVIWRRDAARILAAYGDWVAQRPAAKVLVLYDTMWESTAAMAEAIAAGAAAAGVQPRLFHLRHTSLTQLAAEVLDAAAVAFGSPTLNRGLMPAAAAALSYFAGLRPQGKAAVAFGSYGSVPGGPEAVQHALQSLGWELLRDPIRANIVPPPRSWPNVATRASNWPKRRRVRRRAEGGRRKGEGRPAVCHWLRQRFLLFPCCLPSPLRPPPSAFSWNGADAEVTSANLGFYSHAGGSEDRA